MCFTSKYMKHTILSVKNEYIFLTWNHHKINENNSVLNTSLGQWRLLT